MIREVSSKSVIARKVPKANLANAMLALAAQNIPKKLNKIIKNDTQL